MRPVLALLTNLVLALLAALRVPFRLLRRGQRPAYVRFVLTGDPPYRTALRARGWRFRRKRGQAVRSLEELRGQLARLGEDETVRGIVLDVEGVAIPSAKRLAIAEMLERFRSGGKEVVGTAIAPDNGAYALLCAADRIVLPRAGRLELTGFLAEATAVGAGLQRLGISAEFVRRGDYKTTPELFTRFEPSAIQRETLEQLLDARHDELVDAVAAGRRWPREFAARKVDHGPYSARRALAEGLVDALASEAELEALLVPAARALDDALGRPRWIRSHSDYAASVPWPAVRWRRLRAPVRLAVVPISGMIVQGLGGGFPIGPSLSGSTTAIEGLRSALRDRACPAVLLYVNSPGGSAVASELVLDEVRRVGEHKPVVAFVDRVAASGGYMVALGAREIWSDAHAILGSIGVFAGKFDISGLLERLGIHRTVITRGEHAGLFTASRGFSPPERAALEADVDEIYRGFVDHVAAARRLSVPEVLARAEGRIFSGARALAEGLVDRIGSFEDACRRGLQLASAPAERFEIHVYGLARPKLSLSALLRPAHAQLHALWMPWLTVPGLGGTERWSGD